MKEIDGQEVSGFNVAVGGKMGVWRLLPWHKHLMCFVIPEEASVFVWRHYPNFSRSRTPGQLRNKSRLAFLIADWGVEKFREGIRKGGGTEKQPLLTAGKDARGEEENRPHWYLFTEKNHTSTTLGLVVPVGRNDSKRSFFEVARLADEYGNGDIPPHARTESDYHQRARHKKSVP